ncbi:pentapeptide repeat-containing protein [Candidatus Woesearchaeota archaeon]|nr:pentapeptide repeat-containing protein [Candidatus Woesearchaeota archaeon]
MPSKEFIEQQKLKKQTEELLKVLKGEDSNAEHRRANNIDNITYFNAIKDEFGAKAEKRYGRNGLGLLYNFSKADLSGMDLQGVNLDNTRLWDTNLRGANLEDASLRYVTFDWTNLSRTNLKNAKLINAHFLEKISYANDVVLEGADLRGINLDLGVVQDTYGSNIVRLFGNAKLGDTIIDPDQERALTEIYKAPAKFLQDNFVVKELTEEEMHPYARPLELKLVMGDYLPRSVYAHKK